MQQKRNFGRKLLSILLVLAMVFWLMPGMGLRVKAADALPANGSKAGNGLLYRVGFTNVTRDNGWTEDVPGHVISNLFDGDGNTKICGPLADSGAVFRFESETEFIPQAYYMRTADYAGD